MKTIIDVELSPRWEDLFYPTKRTKKRLIRAFLQMLDRVADELSDKRVSSLEMLVACAVAVWQGYWYCSAPDTQKKQVLDQFATFLFNVVFNEHYLPNDMDQQAQTQRGKLDLVINAAEEKFRNLFITRTDDYTNGIVAFMNGEKFPITLARSLSRNLLSPGKEDTEEDEKHLWEATVMTCVALPFIATFVEIRKGFQ